MRLRLATNLPCSPGHWLFTQHPSAPGQLTFSDSGGYIRPSRGPAPSAGRGGRPRGPTRPLGSLRIVAARRLIFVLLVLLMISSFAAALVPVERNAREDDSSSTTIDRDRRGPAPAAGKLLVRTDRGRRAPRTVRIRLGDQLQLAVAADALDEVEIPALGEIEAVDPDSPALFDLFPLEPGTLPDPPRRRRPGRRLDRGRAASRGERRSGRSSKDAESGGPETNAKA